MANHFSDMGFNNICDETDIVQILKDNIETAKEIKVGRYHFFCVCIDGCIEIWYKTLITHRRGVEIVHWTLHYNTETTTKIINPEWVRKEKGCEILQIWFEDETYPFNIEVVDKKLTQRINFNKSYHCQIACFADAVEIFKTEKGFSEQYGIMGTKSVIPTGTFDLGKEKTEQTAQAVINGIVKGFQRKTNSYTGESYYHVVLESIDVDFDVLVAEALIDQQLEINDIMSVRCWVSGRIEDVIRA